MFMEFPYTRIVFGRGSLRQLGMLASLAGRRALLVTGRSFSKEHGHLDRALESLKAKGIEVEVESGIESDPLDSTVDRLAARVKEVGPDFLVALGGGSVMDATKMANVCARLDVNMGPLYGTDQITPRLEDRDIELLPVITVPTTSGSGSEITRYAVITDTSVELKKIIIDFALCPSIALVDPELTLTCPPEVTRVSGLDTLSHLIEGYMNYRDVSEVVDESALEGIRLVLDYLPRAVENGGDIEAREKMSRACLLGAMVITFKGTGLPHGFSFSFYGVVPHGSGVTLTLPYSWAYSVMSVEQKTRELAGLFGAGSEGPIRDVARDTIQALIDFYRKVGHPTTLSEIEGIDEERIRRAAADMKMNPSKLENAPRPVPIERSEEILTSILEAAYTGDYEPLIEMT